MAESEFISASTFQIGDIIQNAEGQTFVVTNVDLTPGLENVSVASFTYGEELPTQMDMVIDNATTNTNYVKISDSATYNQSLISARDQANASQGLTGTGGLPGGSSSTMDFSKISEVLSQWQNVISTFSGSVLGKTTASVYTELTSAGLEAGFAQSYDTAINNLITGLNNLQSTISASAGNMAAIDDSITPPPPPPSDDNDLPGGGGNNNDGYTPSASTLVDNSKQQLESYQKVSMSDLGVIAQELNGLARKEGKTFEEILNSDAYAEKIRNTLLLSQHVPEDLKQLLTDGDSTISQSVLGQIFNGNQTSVIGLNDKTKITLTRFLTVVAESNNLSLNSLLNDENNSRLLKEALGNFNNVQNTLQGLTDEQMREQILNVYDGAGIQNLNSGTVNIIRNHTDSIIGESQSIEDAIGSPTVVDEFKNLGKFSVFAGNLTGYSDSSIVSILKNMIK